MNGPQLEDNQPDEAKPEYAQTQQGKPQIAQTEEANSDDAQLEDIQLEDEYEIVSDSPVSDTLMEFLRESEARRREAAAQTESTAASADDSAAVSAALQRAARRKGRRKTGRGLGLKSSANARAQSKNAIVRVPKAAVPAIAPQPAAESALERHQRKCVICAHPEREDIEELFLNWHSPEQTAYHYRIPVRSIFRHAHATGLYGYRQGNLRAVLDRILEQAEDTKITGESVIRAVRAYTCLTEDNNWVEPASRVIFSSAAAPASGELALSGTQGALGAGGNLIETPAIRNDATP